MAVRARAPDVDDSGMDELFAEKADEALQRAPIQRIEHFVDERPRRRVQ